MTLADFLLAHADRLREILQTVLTCQADSVAAELPS